MEREVRISSQAVFIDRKGRVYLEKNKKLGKYSLIGGAQEGNESPLEILQREVYEELNIVLSPERFLSPEEQPIREFSTGLWQSTYFIVILEESEEESIGNHENIKCFSYNHLTAFPEDSFTLHKKIFISQVELALSLSLKSVLGKSKI